MTMKITIERTKLLASIQDVSKAISSRAAIPILTGMKIEARADGVTLTGSDSDISIESFIPTEEDGVIHIDEIEEGEVVIQARYFVDRSEEHTSELQSRGQLVCRLLLVRK